LYGSTHFQRIVVSEARHTSRLQIKKMVKLSVVIFASYACL